MTVLNGLEAATHKAKSITGTMSATPRAQQLFHLTEEPRTYQGYMNGYRQPVAQLKIRIHPLQNQQIAELQNALCHYFPSAQDEIQLKSPLAIALCFAELVALIQKMSGFPIFEAPQAITNANKEQEFLLWIPMLFANCFHPVAAFLIKLFNYHLQHRFIDETFTAELNTLVTKLKPHAPQGLNRLPLLQAAFEQQIPWRHLVNNTFQLGYGIHSRWLDSTFTDKTPHIPTAFAESKLSMAYVLAQAGFPTTEPYAVHNELDAQTIADRLGYPVVIKPLDGRGGHGVFPNLISNTAVKNAFHKTSQHTQNVILERHVIGKDYRIVILNGKMLWAIERIPAGVTGDGVNTIAMLIARHNECYQELNRLRLIYIKDDTLEYLAQQGYNLNSIPKSHQFIQLNRISNISAGGIPIAVFDQVHPDNQRLLEAAAQFLRLDFVGIDFIISDISKSYREVGGKIIEINVQPQLGNTTAPGIYNQIIQTLVPDQGRIPIAIVYGNNTTAHTLIGQLQAELATCHKKIALATGNSAQLNDQLLVTAPSLFIAGQHLLSLNEVDALIYQVDEYQEVERLGLPFDRYDCLFFLEAIEPLDCKNHKNALDTLLKACEGETIILESSLAKITEYTDHETILQQTTLNRNLRFWIDAVCNVFKNYRRVCFRNSKDT